VHACLFSEIVQRETVGQKIGRANVGDTRMQNMYPNMWGKG